MNIEDILELDCYLSQSFLKKNNIDISIYSDLIVTHNKEYIAKHFMDQKNYFNNLFKEIDNNINLDTEQRVAILTDEDYNLIIAGAGSGKTTTMIAKIKYLIDYCNIKSEEILAISFGRKNTEELDYKLNDLFHLQVKTSTFHKLGLDIIKLYDQTKYDVAHESQLYFCIQNYMQKEVYYYKQSLHELLNFLICYFEFDPEIKNFESLEDYHKYKIENTYNTVRSDLGKYNKIVIDKRTKIKRTIKSEYLRSKAEVNVANFLFLNGLDYEYERKYKKVLLKGSYYHPDFTVIQGENIVYIEVLSINENGESEIYNNKGLEKYNFTIDLKKRLLLEEKANLILVYASYFDGLSPIEHLKYSLIKFGFVLNQRTEEDIYHELMESDINKYYHNFSVLVSTFIQKCKINEINPDTLLYLSTLQSDRRTKEFIRVIVPIYRFYNKYLEDRNLLDFDDMILKAKNYLESSDSQCGFPYKYIIVDEYQDISNQRFQLIQNLSKLIDSKIIAVGDDWQSIFGFAGSNVELFTKFKEQMGYAEILKIQHTYRNAQELIDIAGEFVQKNDGQIKKSLISEKHIDKPVIVYSYDDMEKGTKNVAKCNAIVEAIKNITQMDTSANILILGRYNFDKSTLIDSDMFKEKPQNKLECISFPTTDITFQTIHKSKGLEYDYVIIVNAIDSKYGFPSKVNDDPIFSVFNLNNRENTSVSYAEERRLFYVALTRTKNSVSIIVPRSKPSPFILEIKDNIHVEFKDDIINSYYEKAEENRCPKCHAFLQYGFSNIVNDYVYYCTTDTEVCGFMTNDLNTKINLIKCPNCEDGYLCYKTTTVNGVYMLGCTNYDETDKKRSCGCVYFVRPSDVKKGGFKHYQSTILNR